MTRNEFVAECEKHGIAPEIALENENLQQALKDRCDDSVRRVLREEF